MPTDAHLQDHQATICIFEHYDQLTCRVLAAAANDGGISQKHVVSTSTSPSGGNRKRLREAEIEARTAGFLCFLKSSPSELWIFYTHNDLNVDLTGLSHRHGLVFVENLSMTFSVRDLLEDQYISVYETFICSVLAGLDRQVNHIKHITLLNPRTVILQPQNSHGYEVNREPPFVGCIDLQLVNGKIILSIKKVQDNGLKALSKFGLLSLEDCPNWQSDALLSPCGKLARLRGIASTHDSGASRGENLQKEDLKRLMWQDTVRSWLTRRGIEVAAEDAWADVEVIMPWDQSEDTQSTQGTERDLQMLRSIIWPSSLVFAKERPRSTVELENLNTLSTFKDPLATAEEWFKTSDVRSSNASKQKAARKAEQTQRDRITTEAANRDDAFASSPTMPRNDIHAAAAIYPTPPDGPLSHVTPGMTSVDGAITTPHEAVDFLGMGSAPIEQGNKDTDMVDLEPPGVPGFFEDDLFDDHDLAHSESGEIDENPDWDFFDDPEATSEGIGGSSALSKRKSSTDRDIMQDSEEAQIRETATLQPPLDHSADLAIDGQSHTSRQPEMESDLAEDTPSQALREHQAKNIQDATGEPNMNLDALEPNQRHHVSESTPLQSKEQKSLTQEQKDGEWADDEKYNQKSGKFWFGQASAADIYRQKMENFANNHSTPTKSDKAETGQPQNVEESRDEEISDGVRTPTSSASTAFDSNEMFSEHDHTVEDLWTNLKRKWAQVSSSPAASVVLMDEPERQSIEADQFALLDKLFDDNGQWSLECWLNAEQLEEDSPVVEKSNDLQLQISQLLVDQVSQSFLMKQDFVGPSATYTDVQILEDLSKALEPMFGSTARPSLVQAYGICDSFDAMDGKITKPETTKLRYRRGGKELEALSSLLPFWETFALEPMNGKKDITAFCVYPEGDMLLDRCRDWLFQLSQMYRSCNFGHHVLGSSAERAGAGFIPFTYNETDTSEDLHNVCKALGTELAAVPPSSTIVIYIVHPLPHRKALVDICSSLIALFMSYAKGSQDMSRNVPEIVPQIIPLAFITAHDILVMPTKADYLHLALEVYNRCPAKDSSDDEPAAYSPAVLLAGQASKSVIFRLSASGASPLQRDRKSLHVAYSTSTNGRWVTAAWTDHSGKKALTMSYCLKSRCGGSGPGRSIVEVVKDMWQICFDIISPEQGQWRITVARDGWLDDVEANTWIHCHNHQMAPPTTSTLRASLVLLSIDTEPSFRLLTPEAVSNISARITVPSTMTQAVNTPTTAAFPLAPTNTALGTYGTPTSTPTPSASQSILSPEQNMAAGTPSAMGALTPTPSVPTTSQGPSQHSAPPTHSPAPTSIRHTTSQMQTAQSQPQSQQSSTTTTQSQSEIQAVLESDPSAFLSRPDARYVCVLSPYPSKRLPSLLDKHSVIATAFLLRTSTDADSLRLGTNILAQTSSPETVLGVHLVWASSDEEVPSTSDRMGQGGRDDTGTPASQRSLVGDVDESDLGTDKGVSTSTSPTKSAIGSIPDSPHVHGTNSQVHGEGRILLHDVLPSFHDLIVLSQSRGLGYSSAVLETRRFLDMADGGGEGKKVKERLLPWHIMTALRGRRILESTGL